MCTSKKGQKGVRQRVRHHGAQDDSHCGKIKDRGMNETETDGETKSEKE